MRNLPGRTGNGTIRDDRVYQQTRRARWQDSTRRNTSSGFSRIAFQREVAEYQTSESKDDSDEDDPGPNNDYLLFRFAS
jgi:hypothetical protein